MMKHRLAITALTLWVVIYSGGLVAHSASTVPLKIALIEDMNDDRYSQPVLDAQYPQQPWGRLHDAITIALKESKFSAQAAGIKIEYTRHEISDLDELPHLMRQLRAEEVKYFLLDLTDQGVRTASDAIVYGSLLFNLSALGNDIRNQHCQQNLFHVAPSRAMLTDAMAQYLVAKKWKNVLILYGTGKPDETYLQSMRGSAKKFGLNIVSEKQYLLGSDPRARYQNNIALMTARDKYDVVMVVDQAGEFAVEVPYAIAKPHPVVGSAGLVADWWHWNWDRNGAPQVNKRFLKQSGRHMTGYDWSAWFAVKVIIEAILRSGTVDIQTVSDYLSGGTMKMDGAKSYPMNFRSWDKQLRQPIFLSYSKRVIAVSPLDGFLHPTNNLDILGQDSNDRGCVLRAGKSHAY